MFPKLFFSKVHCCNTSGSLWYAAEVLPFCVFSSTFPGIQRAHTHTWNTRAHTHTHETRARTHTHETQREREREREKKKKHTHTHKHTKHLPTHARALTHTQISGSTHTHTHSHTYVQTCTCIQMLARAQVLMHAKLYGQHTLKESKEATWCKACDMTASSILKGRLVTSSSTLTIVLEWKLSSL